MSAAEHDLRAEVRACKCCRPTKSIGSQIMPTWCQRCESESAAADELDALRAELAALKARRCDGCAHWTPRVPEIDALLGRKVGYCGINPIETRPDFSCAAWTEKP